MRTLKDKVIWITGASSGIGEGLAYALAKQGAKLILSSRRKEALEKVKSQCFGDRNSIVTMACDLTQIDLMPQLVKQAVEQFGRIDLLINGIGVSQRSLIKETSLEVERKLMEINYWSHVALTKNLLPYLLKQQSGHIVVLSSLAGKMGVYYRSSYCAAKHALYGFFETLRLEMMDENIKVMIACIGWVNTTISLRALTKDGSSYGIVSKGLREGISVDYCAEKIIKGILREKDEVFVGGKEMVALWLKFFVPSLFKRMLKKHKED